MHLVVNEVTFHCNKITTVEYTEGCKVGYFGQRMWLL